MMDVLKMISSKDAKKVMKAAEEASMKLSAFADTYLGVYDLKTGEQLEEGDRDRFYKLFEQILKELAEIKERLDKLEGK